MQISINDKDEKVQKRKKFEIPNEVSKRSP